MTRINKFVGLLLLLQFPAFCQEFTSYAEEKSEQFSYYKNSVDQLGFKDCPEATAVTNGGIFSNSFAAFEFLWGDSLSSATKRVVALERGYLPILKYTIDETALVFSLEAFSAPKELKAHNNLVTFIRCTIKNTSQTDFQTKIGLKITPLHQTGWTEYIRHNRYCTPWYRDQFMNINSYENGIDDIQITPSGLIQGDHLLLTIPDGFKVQSHMEGKQEIFYKEISLSPGASEEFIFKMPVVPVSLEHASVIDDINELSNVKMKNKVIDFWEDELDKIASFNLPEDKVMQMFKTSYINLLSAKDLLEDKSNTIQRCNEFQYDYFYVRDNAYFARIYDMLGQHETSKNILQPYFIRDIEGNTLHFRQRTGIYKKLCHDYWGQVLWAFGSHYRQTRDMELLKEVYELLPNHIKEFNMAVEKDPRGLWPASWPYDNEHINGHYTGHSFWAILGLRYAVFMAEEMGKPKDAEEWRKIYKGYKENFERELEKITRQTDGYIPPGMDDPRDGYDWANASAGLYPFEAIDKDNPVVKSTLETVRNYNFMEGISTYSGCNAFVAKEYIRSNKELPKRGLHHYETFYVTNGNLVIGEQRKVIEDLYSILVHTSSTHGGFEWKPTPWGNRDPGFNRQPHGWCAARYIELIRNMLVREEGADIHILSAVSPEWIADNKTIEVENAPTYFGNVSYKIYTENNKFTLSLNSDWNEELQQVFFHVPWFIKPTQILIDGNPCNSICDSIQIDKNAREIVVSWEKRIPENLNFAEAVNIYLHKYYNRPADADYTRLFPLSVIDYQKDKDSGLQTKN